MKVMFSIIKSIELAAKYLAVLIGTPSMIRETHQLIEVDLKKFKKMALQGSNFEFHVTRGKRSLLGCEEGIDFIFDFNTKIVNLKHFDGKIISRLVAKNYDKIQNLDKTISKKSEYFF